LAGITIANTNDMPIVWPDACDALGLVPFNFNPHYLDPETSSKHMGETRATRIQEFHTYHSTPVLGLREGSWLTVKEGIVLLEGHLTARLFKRGVQPLELNPGDITPFI
jgi:dipeptidase E